jgi:2-dehydro-3-deoxyglucarate aldolase/4-hydroxy-2-oxoheptanedioate aldolase
MFNFNAVRSFRQKLEMGRRCLGPGIALSDPAVTEALGTIADFVWIDLEHSTIGPETLLAHLIAARAAGTTSLVRVAGSDVALIKPVLDAGADGIIVPQVRSADEVQRVVDECRYPPLGRRGYGPKRPSAYGREGGADYVTAANDLVFVAIQVENIEAVAELEAILAIPGLDSIVVGPYDLSGSMGRLGQVSDPEVITAIRKIVAQSRAAGKYVGMGMGPDEDHARWAFEIGVQWVQCGGDYSYMVRFADQLFDRVRSRLAE